MSLTLHIVSQQARAMGAAATFHFDEPGGSIGRIDGNDWILPDAERFVSSRHASVKCEGGSWYLTDISTNGTYVNDPGFLIGNGHTVPLNDGDRLYIGDYEISVSLVGAATTGAHTGSPATGAPTGGYGPPASPTGGYHPRSDPDPFSGQFTGQNADLAIPDAGENLDPMAAFDRNEDDPFAPQPSSSQPSSHQTGPSQGSSLFDDDYDDPGLDPLVAYENPDLTADSSAQEQWPEESGSVPDHASPLDQAFTPPRASSGMIPDNWIDETVLPAHSSQEPEAFAPPSPPASTPQGSPPQSAPQGPPPRSAPQSTPQTSPPDSAPAASTEPPASGPAASGVYPQPGPPPGSLYTAGNPGTGMHRPPEPTMRAPAISVDPGSIEGLERLLTAAGVDPSRMPPQAANAIFQLAGGVFREMVEGVMEVLRARDELKSELRIARTVIQSAKNNPLKFSVSTDEALTKLLFPQEHGYMAPVEALREAIEDIKAHQMAMMAGLSAALTSILEQFDPENLEDQFKKNLKHSPIASLMGKSKYWEMYEDLYKQLSGDSQSDILALYGEEFAKAYQDQIDKLS